MTIINLLERVQKRCTQQVHPFINQEATLRHNYLMGIAMQAHADGILDKDEKVLYLKLASAFDVPEETALAILEEARYPDEERVMSIRKHLIDSKYKYYFILDLQIMAHQDGTVQSVETQVIQKLGQLLEIDPTDIHFFTGLADAVVEENPDAKERWVHSFLQSVHPTGIQPQDFTYYTDPI